MPRHAERIGHLAVVQSDSRGAIRRAHEEGILGKFHARWHLNRLIIVVRRWVGLYILNKFLAGACFQHETFLAILHWPRHSLLPPSLRLRYVDYLCVEHFRR